MSAAARRANPFALAAGYATLTALTVAGVAATGVILGVLAVSALAHAIGDSL